MSDNDDDDDAKSCSGNSNAKDGLVSEIESMPAHGDKDRNEHRKGIQVWIGVGIGVLLMAVVFGILIPTVIINHDSTSANAGAVQELDTGQVRWRLLTLVTGGVHA
jgi:hypothetical protein